MIKAEDDASAWLVWIASLADGVTHVVIDEDVEHRGRWWQGGWFARGDCPTACGATIRPATVVCADRSLCTACYQQVVATIGGVRGVQDRLGTIKAPWFGHDHVRPCRWETAVAVGVVRAGRPPTGRWSHRES